MQLAELGIYIDLPEGTPPGALNIKDYIAVYNNATGEHETVYYQSASHIVWESFGGSDRRPVPIDSIKELLLVEFQVAARIQEVILEKVRNSDSGEIDNLIEKLEQATSRLSLMRDAQDLTDPKGNAAASKYFEEKKEEFGHALLTIPAQGILDRDPPRLSPNASLLEIARYQSRQKVQANNQSYRDSLAGKIAACGSALNILQRIQPV